MRYRTWRVAGCFLATAFALCGSARSEPVQYPELLAVGDVSAIAPQPSDRVICFALYTLQHKVLKLSAQCYPLAKDAEQSVVLEAKDGDAWRTVAKADVHPVGWTATFRVEGWDDTRDTPYRVRHPGGATYEGVIRRDPVAKTEIVAAVFTGNSPGPGGGKIAKRDVVDNVLKLDPDVLLFTGDQVYDHTHHTAHWLMFGENFGDLMRDRPTVCLPDDHDVGQPNLWGQGGRPAKVDVDGGYTRPVEYVKMVERQQTSHLPDPYDPTPVERGIGVYYTALNIGGVDFAIIEDRKFKSGCADLGIVEKGLGSRADHIEKPGYDPKAFDLPGKELLGARQMKFLREWGMNWTGAVMKAVVSQTAFNVASTHHGPSKAFYYVDFDANGWPQAERNKSVDLLRRCFAVHLCGDQHLATLGQYGIDGFRDSGWWFCVPSIANLYPRWWQPKQEPLGPAPGAVQDNTGDYVDGLGNRMTIYAHTNPVKAGREPAELLDRMPGFGIARFDKQRRTIAFECWPRMTDPTDPKSKQYAGWPRTVSQFDNYPREAAAWLPELKVKGAEDPVVQIIDEENGEVVYTLRIRGTTFRPKVFKEGTYTILASGSDPKNVRKLTGIRSLPETQRAELPVEF
jgi:hypothetical protein